MGDETRRLINALMTCIRDNGEFKGRAELLIWGSSVLSGPPHTITLPRAEVEALLNAAQRLRLFSGGYSGKLADKNNDAFDKALATLQERMK